jgi:subtilisin family serine protease
VGVAPEAELIVVANTRPAASNPGSFGDSADTLDAVRYILQVAETRGNGKPVAINLSQGDNLGPHDGTSLLEQGIATLIDGPGRVLIKSAGNDAVKGHHAEGVVVTGTTQDVRIGVAADQQDVTVDIWYAGADRIALRITPPGAGATTTTPFVPEFSGLVRLDNRNDVFVDTDLDDPGNHDNRIFLVLHRGGCAAIADGVWTLHLDGSGPWHAWIQRGTAAAFKPPFVSQAMTISIPGTMQGGITVASHISNGPFVLGSVGSRSDFSGCGPTRDGRRGITVSAPGEELTAPQPGNGTVDRFGTKKGTSMSAAMVTGAAAVLLSIDPTLSADDIRTCLEKTARSDAHTPNLPNSTWGAGKLDVQAAVKQIEP